MILSTNNVTHELILNNRNVVRMLDMLGTDDLSAAMLDGMNHVNTKKLATAIYALDRSNFKSVDEVYDFLDDYKAEHECTVREIYADLIREFNDHYFFDRKMTEKELRNIQQVGGINVHNDYLQFMAEHGMIGFGCIVAIVVMLIWPLGRVWRAMMNSIRFIPPKDQPPPPVAIFVVPAPVFCILSAVVATLIHCFGDCPMRSPAVLSLFFIELAAMDGFLPRVKEK